MGHQGRTQPHLLASVHLPLSPSSGGGGGTPGRASQSAKEPVWIAAGETRRQPTAGLQEPGLALVRMPEGRAAGVRGVKRGGREPSP